MLFKQYFVSGTPDVIGGSNIYIVEHNNGEWDKPQNMGSEINIELDETFLHI